MGVKNKIDRKKLEEVMKEIRIMKENEESRHMNSEIESNISNVGNIKSRGGSSYGRSMCTDISEDRLSTREVGKLKRLIVEREKWERRNNILLKGVKLENEEKFKKVGGKECVSEFLRENLDKVCKVESCRISGKVIIIKLIRKRKRSNEEEE